MIPSLLSIAAALGLCFAGIAIVRSTSMAIDAFSVMTWGAFGDWPRYFESGEMSAVLRPLGESATRASLLIMTGLSIAVAFRVGLFNIGAQGQFMVGALAAAWLGANFEVTAWIHLPVCLAGAALGGALYASIAALLKITRGVHEVISTIMLNWVAVSFIDNWLVSGPLRATAQGESSISGTAQIAPTAELPRILGDVSRLHWGSILALVVSMCVAIFLSRFVRGYEWRVAGLNRHAAEVAGIHVDRCMFEAMALSGALAGLAGAMLILGTELKYPASIGSSYGFDGIAIAFIAQSNPFGIVAASVFFGGLRSGGTGLQLLGIHKSFPDLIAACALVFMAMQSTWERVMHRWRRA